MGDISKIKIENVAVFVGSGWIDNERYYKLCLIASGNIGMGRGLDFFDQKDRPMYFYLPKSNPKFRDMKTFTYWLCDLVYSERLSSNGVPRFIVHPKEKLEVK